MTLKAEVGTVLINGHKYLRPIVDVAEVRVDGGTACIVLTKDLLDTISDGSEYTVRIKTISKAKFEAMPEFEGW